MTAEWRSDWERSDCKIGAGSRLDEMVYRVGNRAEIEKRTIVAGRRFDVTGVRGARQIWSADDAVASVVGHKRRRGGEHFSLEAGDVAVTLDLVTRSKPKIRIAATKLSVVEATGTMTDALGTQVVVIKKRYQMERISSFLSGVRTMEGEFDGALKVNQRVPTAAVLLALHLTLRPEKHARVGRFIETAHFSG